MEAEFTNTDILMFLAAAEFLVIIVIALAAFLFVVSKRKKSDTNATSNLVNKIKSQKLERKSELSGVLAETYNIEGDKLKKETEKLVKLENQFYQRFIKTYLTRDANAVEMIDEDLKELLANYNQLVPKQESRDERAEEALAVIDNLSDDSGEHDEQIKRLKDTINNLSDDLKQYKNTVNRLFYEYSAMFGVDVDPRNQLSATEILSRLETGRLGDEEPSLADIKEDDLESEAPVYFDDSIEVTAESEETAQQPEPEQPAMVKPKAAEPVPEQAPQAAPKQEATPDQKATPNNTSSQPNTPPAKPLPDELIAELLGDDDEGAAFEKDFANLVEKENQK